MRWLVELKELTKMEINSYCDLESSRYEFKQNKNKSRYDQNKEDANCLTFMYSSDYKQIASSFLLAMTNTA